MDSAGSDVGLQNTLGVGTEKRTENAIPFADVYTVVSGAVRPDTSLRFPFLCSYWASLTLSLQ